MDNFPDNFRDYSHKILHYDGNLLVPFYSSI